MNLRKKRPTTLDQIQPRTHRERALIEAIKEKRQATDNIVQMLHSTIRQHKQASK